ncbi:MAG: TIGR03619 family F420-dependent LLM class oxidoreductase [Micromonosporaceae bacterium]
MRIGVNVPNFGPGAEPDVLLRWARIVEGLDLDLLMLSDHLAITPDVAEQYPAPFAEPFTTLAWLAGHTSRVRLGTTVLVMPYRHPLLTARVAANLNRLSGGRLVLGVGIGWARQEFQALGVDFRRRGALTDEYLHAVREAWRDEDDYRGSGVPIWVGGNSDAGIRRAVRFSAPWHPLRFRPTWLDSALVRLKEAADSAGSAVPGLVPRIALRLLESPLPDSERLTGEGTLDQVLGDMERLRVLGADTVVFDPYDGDPMGTGDPGTAWRDLATVTAAWRRTTEESR